jgi:hypothetical protein
MTLAAGVYFLHDALAYHHVVLPPSCFEQGSSALTKDLALGLKHGRADLSVLMNNVDSLF